MPFSVLIVGQGDPSDIIRLLDGLLACFKRQFSEEDDRVIAVSGAFELAGSENNFDLIVYESLDTSNAVLGNLINRSLFRATFYRETGNEFIDHMLSCHSGDITVAVDKPNWGEWLAKKAKIFLCSQLVNGGLDAIFHKRDHRCLASPYEGRFRRFFVHGRGLTHALANLQGTIMAYWNFLDERTQKRVKEQFTVDFDQEFNGERYPVFVSIPFPTPKLRSE